MRFFPDKALRGVATSWARASLSTALAALLVAACALTAAPFGALAQPSVATQNAVTADGGVSAASDRTGETPDGAAADVSDGADGEDMPPAASSGDSDDAASEPDPSDDAPAAGVEGADSFADGEKSATQADPATGERAAEAGEVRADGAVCRIGAIEFDTLREAVFHAVDGDVIEMMVSSYVAPATIGIQNKRITIATAAADPAIDVCVLSLDPNLRSADSLFFVSEGAGLTLDGTRNGLEGAQGNGIVLSPQTDDGKAEDELTGQAGIRAERGEVVLKDVTVKGFTTNIGGGGANSPLRSAGLSLKEATGSLEGTSLIENCTVKSWGGVKESAGGISVYGLRDSAYAATLTVGPQAVVRGCSGPTGGISVSSYANATIRGTIDSCTANASNQIGGGMFISEKSEVTLEGAVISGNKAIVQSPLITAGAGGIYVFDGLLKIHGATVVDNECNAQYRNAAGGIGLSTLQDGKKMLAHVVLSGKVVIKDNKTTFGKERTRNLVLACDPNGPNTQYLGIDGDLDPQSHVGVFASYIDDIRHDFDHPVRMDEGEEFAVSLVNADRSQGTDKYRGDAGYSGDASVLSNLYCLVNDNDSRLRGAPSWDGWKTGLLDKLGPLKKKVLMQSIAEYPAAIVWAKSYDIAVKKEVVDPTGAASGTFPFKVATGGRTYEGEIHRADGTPTGQTVAAGPDGTTFSLADGEYLLFRGVTFAGAAQPDAGAIEVEELGGMPEPLTDATIPYSAEVSAATAGGSAFGTTGVSADGFVQWRGNDAGAPDDGDVTVTFANTVRSAPLRVSLAVEGAYADAARPFDFELTLKTHTFVDTAHEFTARVIGADGNPTGETYRFRPAQPTDFSLKGGESLLFDDLAVGTFYDMSQRGVRGYRVSAEVSTLDAQGAVASTRIAQGAAGAGLSFTGGKGDRNVLHAMVAYDRQSPGANAVSVVDELPYAPPTDVRTASDSWSSAIAFGAGGVFVLMATCSIAVATLRKRRM